MNKDRVKRYHDKLTSIKLRLPAEDTQLGIPDYPAIIRKRAAQLGLYDKKGNGSANAYLIHLIENDIGIHIVKLSDIPDSTDNTDKQDNKNSIAIS